VDFYHGVGDPGNPVFHRFHSAINYTTSREVGERVLPEMLPRHSVVSFRRVYRTSITIARLY
jgi:hypothetical protein